MFILTIRHLEVIAYVLYQYTKFQHNREKPGRVVDHWRIFPVRLFGGGAYPNAE